MTWPIMKNEPLLIRYGVTWDGSPGQPLLTPMPDGYWTPWHIALALAQSPTCATCAHYDANSAAAPGVGYCTNPNGWHRARSMPPHESCTKWEAVNEEHQKRETQ
jgi:hypothetical protein